MQPLIKITTTPIKISMKVERGQFEEIKPVLPQANTATRVQNAPDYQPIQQTPYSPQVQQAPQQAVNPNLDSVQLSRQTFVTSIPLEFTSVNEAGDGKMTKGKKSYNLPTAPVSQIIRQRVMSNESSNVAFIANNGDDTKWQPSTIELQIDMNYSSDVTQMKYIPGHVSIEIEEYPSIKIEYLGGPMYVPPSADPKFKK